MSTFEKLLELMNFKREAINAGDPIVVEQIHNDGKLTARERIAKLFDEGTFIELGSLVAKGATIEGVITGYGTVEGALVYGYAQDVTLDGGAVTDAHCKKIKKILKLAKQNGAPVVSILDSHGAKISDGLDTLAALAKVVERTALLSGIVPQISIVLGACAGANAFIPALADFTIMVDKESTAYITTPFASGAVSDAKVNAENTGLANFVAQSDEDALYIAKTLLTLLPSNYDEMPLPDLPTDDINRISENILPLIDGDYDAHLLIKEFADTDSILEISAKYAKEIVTSLVKLNGYTVGIVANNPSVSRLLSIDGTKKASKFIGVCDSFNIPVVSLIDIAGFEGDKDSEVGGITRFGAKLLASYAEATVPKINVVIGDAYGSGYMAMGGFTADFAIALPSAKIAVMSSDTAANVLYNEEIKNSGDPIGFRQVKITEYEKTVATPYVAATRGYIDDVVEPDSIRPRVISALDMLYTKKVVRAKKKHNNFSV